MRLLLSALLLFAAAPAWADTTALYEMPQGGQMRFEVASNGNVRATPGAGATYMLTVQGEDFMVFYAEQGPVVARMTDVAAAMLAHIQKNMPQMLTAPEPTGPDPFSYVKGGQMTVNGRAGTVWYMRTGDALIPEARFVMSTDPDLAELGATIVRQTQSSMTEMGAIFRGHHPMSAMLDVLKTGAPILYNGMKLTSITHTAIAQDRFVLPATPQTADQVRARLEANGGNYP